MANMSPMTRPSSETQRETAERAARTLSPRVDIYETEKAYVVLADLPGVSPQGLDVVAERDELIIRGRVQRPAATPDYQEFELADYHRAFTLTEDLDPAAISAVLRDGVLRVEIPKSMRVQPKKIPVRAE
jgi:HSP20 family protein